MSEMILEFYARHPQVAGQRAVGKLLRSLADDEDQLTRAAVRLNPDMGARLTGQLLLDLDGVFAGPFVADDVRSEAGFMHASFMGGPEMIDAGIVLLRYFHHLNPHVHALAYLSGDPWEGWIKVHRGATVFLECSPFSGHDAFLKGTVYRWWHEGLPEVIAEGLLNTPGNGEFVPVSEEEYQEWLKDVDALALKSRIEVQDGMNL